MKALENRTRRLIWAMGMLILAACPGHSLHEARPAAALAPEADTGDIATLAPVVSISYLETLFGAARSSVTPAEVKAGDSSSVEGYREWVQQVLRDPETYKILTPVLLGVFVELPSDKIVGFLPLLEGQSRSKGTFYYRQTPCPERELERVRPWWQPSTEVWVCRDDHHPDVLEDGGYSCDLMFPLPEGSRCGCGPNLMFCGTKELQSALKEATREELHLTLKHVIESGRPFGDLLTMNETVRSGLGDLFARRADFFLTHRFEPPDLEEAATPRPRPRPAPLQGGLLSTPLFLFGDSQRSMVASIWETFLCVPLRSQAVETHTILEKLRDETIPRETGLPNLASAEGCQSCHARLEHGQSFLAGWQSWLKGMHYVPEIAAATPSARFYLRDHRDLRGEVSANLDSLGKMIIQQDEFDRCMVSKVMNFVYEGNVVPHEVERHLLARFKNGQRMKDLIEDAIIARAFGVQALTEDRGAAVRTEELAR